MASTPVALAAGDINGDGKCDLAVASSVLSTTVAVVLAGSNDSFGAPTEIWSGSAQDAEIALVDINGDTHLDIVATVDYRSHFSNLMSSLGNGDGTFAPFTIVETYSSGESSVHAAHFNADGIVDIAVASSDLISIRLGNGDGSFQPPTSSASILSEPPVCMAVGDLNGDGKVDVAVGTPLRVAVHLGNGDGTLGPRASFPNSDTPASIVIADLDENGLTDLVLANGFRATLSVLPGTGNGAFGAATEFPTGSHPTTSGIWRDPQFVGVDDFDQDGTVDVVATNTFANTVSVHLGNGDGSFGQTHSVGSVPGPRTIAAGKFNGDGFLDLTVSSVAGELSMFPGSGNGSFGPPVATALGVQALMLAADFDRNGLDDVVTANGDTIRIHLAAGGGSFDFAAAGSAPSRCRALAVADLNHDSDLDVVAISGGSPLTPYDGLPIVSTFLGLGNGTLGPRSELTTRQWPMSLGVGDLNGDDHPDIVVAASGLDTTISVFLGTGDGTFQPRMDLAGLRLARELVLGDLNEDGVIDLAVNSLSFDPNGDAVCVFRGLGDGTFGTPTSFPACVGPNGLALQDLNKDSHLDLVQHSFKASTASVLFGRGDGTFGEREIYGTGRGPIGLAIADLNGDGYPELASADWLSNRVSLLQNVPTTLDVEPPSAVSWSALASAYPNPSRGSFTFLIEIRDPGPGTLRIYDVAGRTVRVLVDGPLSPGRHPMRWDGRSAQGAAAPTGIYFCELQHLGRRLIRRLAIVR